jgi:hypothetical protein
MMKTDLIKWIQIIKSIEEEIEIEEEFRTNLEIKKWMLEVNRFTMIKEKT